MGRYELSYQRKGEDIKYDVEVRIPISAKGKGGRSKSLSNSTLILSIGRGYNRQVPMPALHFVSSDSQQTSSSVASNTWKLLKPKDNKDRQHDMVLGKRIAWSIYLHTVIILPCLELLHNRGAVFRPHIL